MCQNQTTHNLCCLARKQNRNKSKSKTTWGREGLQLCRFPDFAELSVKLHKKSKILRITSKNEILVISLNLSDLAIVHVLILLFFWCKCTYGYHKINRSASHHQMCPIKFLFQIQTYMRTKRRWCGSYRKTQTSKNVVQSPSSSVERPQGILR